MQRSKRILPLIPAALVLGCSGAAGHSRIDAKLTRGEPFRLQENEASVLVAPTVAIDPVGGFLVADEAQVRRYDATGRLRWYSGRKGRGPGEYVSPVALTRLSDSAVVALDQGGRFTVLTPDGKYLRDFSLPFSRVEGAVAIGGTKLLVAGVSAEDPDGPFLLHTVDVAGERIETSFFPLPELGNPVVAQMMAYASADVRGDTVVAAFAGLDSVYVFSIDGRRQRAFPLPVDNFRLAGDPPADFSDPAARLQWLSSFETVSGIWWVGPDLIAVSYKTVTGSGMQWHWAIVTEDGEIVHQETDTGRLLAAYPDRRSVVTVAPGSDAPDVWQEMSVNFNASGTGFSQ